MSEAAKAASLIESSSYGLPPDYPASLVWLIVVPTEPDETLEFVNFRNAVSFLLEDTTVAEAVQDAYRGSLDGSRWDDEEYSAFEWEHIEEIAEELGYQIHTTIR